MPRKPSNETSALVERYESLQIESKRIFKEVCELEEELLATVDAAPEARVSLAGGRVLTRRDNFSERNTFFKPTATKRFEVLVI